jgi:flagellar M-ring protein FliF
LKGGSGIEAAPPRQTETELRAVNGIQALLRSLGPGRIASMGAVALLLVGFFAFVILRYDGVTEVPLYTGLNMEDAAAIVGELEAAGIAYSLRENGTAIMVPGDSVLRLRMTLAQEGLPAGGGVGYEIFDKTDALGTTSFVQNVNRLRALEGELARSIRTLRRVENARVHLVLPERQLFRRDAQKPTASVVVKTRGSLDAGEIRAMQHLVASAVADLEPGRISIVDESGRLLAQGNGTNDAALMASSVDERTAAFQLDVETRLRDIVESVVGSGRARVKVAAELDFNRVSETKDLFDPESQVVRSTQTREESSSSSEGSQDQVTVGNQLPNAAQPPADGTAATRDNSSVTEETVNYEISKTTRTAVTEAGGVRRLSVAVLVDGQYITGPDGVQAYTPRPQQELDQIAALVRSAMGFDGNRGDQVEVVNLQFAQGPTAESALSEPGFFDFTREELMRLVELAIMAVLTVLILLFAVRPLIRRILAPDAGFSAGRLAAATTGQGGLGLPAPGHDSQTGFDGRAMAQLEGPNGSRLDDAKAAGQAQLDQVRRVGDLVKDNPNEAAIIIRNWLGEAA